MLLQSLRVQPVRPTRSRGKRRPGCHTVVLLLIRTQQALLATVHTIWQESPPACSNQCPTAAVNISHRFMVCMFNIDHSAQKKPMMPLAYFSQPTPQKSLTIRPLLQQPFNWEIQIEGMRGRISPGLRASFWANQPFPLVSPTRLVVDEKEMEDHARRLGSRSFYFSALDRHTQNKPTDSWWLSGWFYLLAASVYTTTLWLRDLRKGDGDHNTYQSERTSESRSPVSL